MMKTENGKIISTYLGEDHGCLTANLVIEGDCWVCEYGDYVLGYWSNSYKKTAGVEAIVALLTTLDIKQWEDLPGTYVRICVESSEGRILKIGHIFKDRWFSFEDYFELVRDAEKKEHDGNG